MSRAFVNRREARCRGLSIAEMVIAIPLVGIVLVAVINIVGSTAESQVRATDGRRGHMLAQELMSEILRQDYADETIAETVRDDILAVGDATYTLGRDNVAGRNELASSNRSLFNDVDDYHDWTASPPQEKDGTVLSGLTGWGRSVSVALTSDSDLTAALTDDVGCKRITVTVTHGGATVAELTALKAMGLPWLEACCLDDASCVHLRAEECTAEGGTPQGAGSDCAWLECSASSTVLFVTGGTCAPTCIPTIRDDARIALIESWGYSVELIGATATQGEFDTAVAAADVAYVSSDVRGNDLGTKLRGATIGVVNEDTDLYDDFGFSSASFWHWDTDLEIVNNTHYITETHSIGAVTLYTSSQALVLFDGTMSTDLNVLGIRSSGSRDALATLEAGDLLYDGETAAGRRVQLPWDTGYGVSVLTSDAETIMRRSIEWAAMNPTKLLFVTAAATPSTQESSIGQMMVSWGFAVTYIDAAASGTDYTAALPSHEVVYVPEGAYRSDLVTKLGGATIGVVFGEKNLAPDLGVSDSTRANWGDQVDILQNTHYITETLALGVLTITNSEGDFEYPRAPLAPDATVLASMPGQASETLLVVVDAGGTLDGGAKAAGRRASVPFGAFVAADFTADGQTLFRRTLEWGAGAEGACGDGDCAKAEQCTCVADCGTPPSAEDLVVGSPCNDGQDNDCDGDIDCDDADCLGDPVCIAVDLCGNGTCDSGEDCDSCAADCPKKTNGPPSGRYCCGNGIVESAEGDGSICDGNY